MSDKAGLRQNSNSMSEDQLKSRRKSRPGSSDKISGFHPLRSLRNIFFGYRNKEPSVKQTTAPKAKSTDDLLDSSANVESDKVKCSDRRLSLAVTSLNKQLSLSADNLVSPGNWLPAPHGIATLSASNETDGTESKAQGSESSDRLEDDILKFVSSESLEEFFIAKWANANEKMRSYSTGDVSDDDSSYQDLDAVKSGGSLDLKTAKDRIAVKPKGKRLSSNIQIKFKSDLLGGKFLNKITEDNEIEAENIFPVVMEDNPSEDMKLERQLKAGNPNTDSNRASHCLDRTEMSGSADSKKDEEKSQQEINQKKPAVKLKKAPPMVPGKNVFKEKESSSLPRKLKDSPAGDDLSADAPVFEKTGSKGEYQNLSDSGRKDDSARKSFGSLDDKVGKLNETRSKFRPVTMIHDNTAVSVNKSDWLAEVRDRIEKKGKLKSVDESK
jgi:hypothetical protein